MVAQPVVGVLALQGDVREHLVALRECDVIARPVRRPAELAEVAGLVLPGGESTTMSKLLETFQLLEPLRARLAEGMPAFGSCAGMILLASHVLDGRADQHQLAAIDMVVRRNAFGRQVDSFENDLEVLGIDSPVHAVFIRAPWVESVGDQVEVLAQLPHAGTPEVTGHRNDLARIVAVRQGSVLATAFHPELTGDARLHQLFTRIVREH